MNSTMTVTSWTIAGKRSDGRSEPPRIGEQRHRGVDDREHQRQPREREQELDVAEPLRTATSSSAKPSSSQTENSSRAADEATYDESLPLS